MAHRGVLLESSYSPSQITCLSLSSSTAESFVDDIECCCLLICYTLLLQEKDVWVILFGPGGMCVFGQWTHVLLLERYFPFSRTFCQIKRKDNKKTGHWVWGGGAERRRKTEVFLFCFFYKRLSPVTIVKAAAARPGWYQLKMEKRFIECLISSARGRFLETALSIHPSSKQQQQQQKEVYSHRRHVVGHIEWNINEWTNWKYSSRPSR